MISCPKCSQQMEQLEQGSIPISRCVNCKGLWLEPSVLERCIEESPQHNMLNISLNSPPPGKGRPAGLGCPGCDGIMLRYKYHGIEIERCPTCKGLYFDSGELNQMMALVGTTPRQSLKGSSFDSDSSWDVADIAMVVIGGILGALIDA